MWYRVSSIDLLLSKALPRIQKASQINEVGSKKDLHYGNLTILFSLVWVWSPIKEQRVKIKVQGVTLKNFNLKKKSFKIQ